MKRDCFFFVMMCAVLCAMLCACSVRIGDTEHQTTPIMSGNSLKLARQKMYIAVPHNTGKGAETAEVAAQTQQALQEALNRTAGEKIYAPMPQRLLEGFVSAKAAACAYLIWIEILDWYDPPAFFQILPDRGEVVLSVYDAQTGNRLQSDKISCKGYATTVNLIGAYSPKDCLKAAFGAWVTKNM